MSNGHEIAMAIRAAYLSMHRQADAILAPYGITANQYVILALLAERDQQFLNRLPRNAGGPRVPSRTDELIAAGWGCVMINPNSIQADNGAGLTRGIIGLTNLGQPRRPDDWGSLRAWAWGASRGLDYLQTDSRVDAKRVGIEGVSRYGKAALVTMAFDLRFAMALVGSSGAGGAAPHRRNSGEAVENLTGSGEYHWMAGNFLKYGAEESTFGSKNASDIPVDSHQLIALCAPRLTFISYGIPEKGDAHWLDQRGSFMATVAASKVFRLLGSKGLGTTDDYMNEPLPPVNEGLLEGSLAWRQHNGGHTDAPNIKYFVAWAGQHLKAQEPSGTARNPIVWCRPPSSRPSTRKLCFRPRSRRRERSPHNARRSRLFAVLPSIPWPCRAALP